MSDVPFTCPIMRWFHTTWELMFGCELLAAMNGMNAAMNDAAIIAVIDDLGPAWLAQRRAAIHAAHTAAWARHCAEAAGAWLPHLVEAHVAYPDHPCLTGDGDGVCDAVTELRQVGAKPLLPQPDDHAALAELHATAPAVWAHAAVTICRSWERVACAAGGDAEKAAEEASNL